MPSDDLTQPLPMYRQKAISQEFLEYCEDVFERRLNSEESFDPAAYRDAMALALERLRRLEDEGRA